MYRDRLLRSVAAVRVAVKVLTIAVVKLAGGSKLVESSEDPPVLDPVSVSPEASAMRLA
jgi:hypothetical protein